MKLGEIYAHNKWLNVCFSSSSSSYAAYFGYVVMLEWNFFERCFLCYKYRVNGRKKGSVQSKFVKDERQRRKVKEQDEE